MAVVVVAEDVAYLQMPLLRDLAVEVAVVAAAKGDRPLSRTHY